MGSHRARKAVRTKRLTGIDSEDRIQNQTSATGAKMGEAETGTGPTVGWDEVWLSARANLRRGRHGWRAPQTVHWL